MPDTSWYSIHNILSDTGLCTLYETYWNTYFDTQTILQILDCAHCDRCTIQHTLPCILQYTLRRRYSTLDMFYYTIPCTVYYRYDATRPILHIRHSRITVHTILYCTVLHRTYFHYAYYTRHTALCILYLHSKQYGTILCTKVTPYRIILYTLPCTHFAFNTVHSTLYIQH